MNELFSREPDGPAEHCVVNAFSGVGAVCTIAVRWVPPRPGAPPGKVLHVYLGFSDISFSERAKADAVEENWELQAHLAKAGVVGFKVFHHRKDQVLTTLPSVIWVRPKMLWVVKEGLEP